MGFDCELTETFSFIYRATLDKGLTEYELDHVLIGHSDETPHLNTDEAMSFKWMSIENIKKEIELHPLLYTEWFKIILEDHYETLLALQYNESF
jgi:isopentenyl-diphosphate delta-isomerase